MRAYGGEPMVKDAQGNKRGETARPDGRKQMLVYLRPDLIHQIKIVAAVEQRHAYEVIESVLEAFLATKDNLPK